MGLAFYNVLGAIGGFISPYIVGRLSNGGSYNSSMYVQGAFNLAAALMVLGELLAPVQPGMQMEFCINICSCTLHVTVPWLPLHIYCICRCSKLFLA